MLSAHLQRVGRRRRQRGLSLVEMMVGVTIGLVVVAGASLLISTQLLENRRLLIETQLQQDLRASADIITRELRRAGTQREPDALLGLWQPGIGSKRNQYADELTFIAGSQVMFWYQPQTGLLAPKLGFLLDGNTLKRWDGSGWQELTDASVMHITEFRPRLVSRSPMQLPCAKVCPNGTTDCWPRVVVREIEVEITGKAKNMPEVVRTINSRVRLRNDLVAFSDATANQMCPE